MAEETDLSAHAIRFYERQGLWNSLVCRDGGFRIFSGKDALGRIEKESARENATMLYGGLLRNRLLRRCTSSAFTSSGGVYVIFFWSTLIALVGVVTPAAARCDSNLS